ncbi:MAG: transporter [Pseudomonadota bacterium]|nr:transporter [Pseudomonadota bacterium]
MTDRKSEFNHMSDRRRRSARHAAVCLIVSLAAGGTAWAEETPAPMAEEDQDKAREVLRQKETDPDTAEYLQEILSSANTGFSLVKKGQWDAVWDLDYTFFGDAQTQTVFIIRPDDSLDLRLADIERDAEHTLTNRFTLDYGVLDNVSLGIRVPIVFKYDDINDVNDFGFGDLSLRARWQPWRADSGEARWTLSAQGTAPTGESPYELELGEELSTGSGYYALGLGVNVSKVVDPVVAFGAFSVNYPFDITDLDQERFTIDGTPLTLEEVRPGPQVNMGLGMAFALSYDVSLTFQYQLGYQTETEFEFSNGDVSESIDETIGVFSIITGWRVSPDRLVNVSVSFGQTDASPDVILGISMPTTVDSLADLFRSNDS